MDVKSAQKLQIVPGYTFDGVPFTVTLDYGRAIDSGATARIYKGEMHTTRRVDVMSKVLGCTGQTILVAVKVFGQILSDAQRELIVRELRAARHVSSTHKCILPFLGTVDVGHQTALVSLYMRNGNLMDYIKARSPCASKTKLLHQVADAVNFLHTDKNLVHGDIKCANILISDHGNARLADFGLSTFIEKSQSELATMTAIRTMNTLRFAAPELINGDTNSSVQLRSKTRESDVYAFGMLVLEVVTEKPPWYGLTDLAVMLRVSTGEHPPRPLHGQVVSTSASAWDMCLKCWRTNPTERVTMENVLDTFRTNGFDIGPVRIMKTRDFTKSVSYMPNGLHIVSGSTDGAVQIWDTRTGLAVSAPIVAPSITCISCIATSPDGIEIASSSVDHIIQRWDAVSGAPIGDTIHSEFSSSSLAYSPDSRTLAFSDASVVRMWHLTADGGTGSTLGHRQWVTTIAFSPDGAHLASGTINGAVCLWDMATRTPRSLPTRTYAVTSIAFAPDSTRLAVASTRQVVRIWDIFSGQLHLELHVESGLCTAVAFSPLGNCLVGLADKACVWDAQTGKLIVSRPRESEGSVCFASDGRTLACSSGWDGVLIWELFAESL